MPRAVYGFLEFTREMDRGLATMRGEVSPGAYGPAQEPDGCRRSLSLRDMAVALKRLGGYLYPGGGQRMAVLALLLAMTL